MSDPSGQDAGGGRSASPAHRALWILGIVLIAGALGATAWAQLLYASNSSDGTSPPDSSYLIAQYIYFVAPGGVTGGIVCVALALAISAIRTRIPGDLASVVEQRDEVPEPAPDIPESAFRVARQDAAADPRAPIDPEAFKRPRTDRHPAS